MPIHPGARMLLSGLNAKEEVSFSCPLSVALNLPVVTSQSLMVWSRVAEAKVSLLGLNATDQANWFCADTGSHSLARKTKNPKSRMLVNNGLIVFAFRICMNRVGDRLLIVKPHH